MLEIFKAINQPLSSEQRVRWYKQRENILLFTPISKRTSSLERPKFIDKIIERDTNNRINQRSDVL